MGKKIILSCGTKCLVSDEDYELLSRFSWHKQAKGYAASRIGSGYVLMHRFLLGAKHGGIVHHRDGNPLNNKRDNLLITNSGTNNHSRHAIKKFPFIGISYRKKTQMYKAAIRWNGKALHLGDFHDPLSAAKAYDQKAIELYGDAAMTNSRFLKALLAKLRHTKLK